MMNNYIILIAYFYVYSKQEFSLFNMQRRINQIAIIKNLILTKYRPSRTI